MATYWPHIISLFFCILTIHIYAFSNVIIIKNQNKLFCVPILFTIVFNLDVAEVTESHSLVFKLQTCLLNEWVEIYFIPT